MARPKKKAGYIDACQRIAEVFWDLLKTNQLSEITVGTIAAKAGVNRGTFYYHFDDINDMIEQIIKNEIFQDNLIPSIFFKMVTGTEQDHAETVDENFWNSFSKVSLLLERGGNSLVSSKIKEMIVEMWTVILMTNEEDMNVSTRLAIEYSSSGMLGTISYLSQQGDPKTAMIETQSFRAALADFMLGQIAFEEGLTKEEVLSRILMTGRFMKTTKE